MMVKLGKEKETTNLNMMFQGTLSSMKQTSFMGPNWLEVLIFICPNKEIFKNWKSAFLSQFWTIKASINKKHSEYDRFWT